MSDDFHGGGTPPIPGSIDWRIPSDPGTDWRVGDEYRQNNSGGGCFTGDTQIRTPLGERRIDSLRQGDEVLSWDAATQSLRTRKIKQVRQYGPSTVSSVELDNGNRFSATRLHSIMTRRGWRRVGALVTGDTVQTDAGQVKVRAVTPQRTKERVYNLITAGEHNFIANGVVAHNFTVLRRTRAGLHSAVEAIQKFRPIFRKRPAPIPALAT